MTEYTVRAKALNPNTGSWTDEGYQLFGHLQWQISGQENVPTGLQVSVLKSILNMDQALFSGRTLEVSVKLS